MRQIFSSKIFTWIIIGIIVLAVGYGIFLAGSPGTQRALQSDKLRESHLQQISFSLDEYWARNQKLPETLEDLLNSRYYFVESIADPITKDPYVYTVLEEKQYELCAVFDLASQESSARLRFPSKVWGHGAGEICFELEVQPRKVSQQAF
jgi:hypothetical protein